MSRRRRATSGFGQALVIVGALLTLAVPVCVFDAGRDGADDHGTSVDFCNVPVAVPATVAPPKSPV